MTIHDLDTPALLVDANVLDRNLLKMAAYCKDHQLALRPHAKTHKMPEIARLQVRYGAAGITVAKLGEAKVMVDAGIEDIVIVYPLWGEEKWEHLGDLASRCRITVAMIRSTWLPAFREPRSKQVSRLASARSSILDFIAAGGQSQHRRWMKF
jgi:D-serine deaminase-like pyridoxal phosphate-dependent protein